MEPEAEAGVALINPALLFDKIIIVSKSISEGCFGTGYSEGRAGWM